MSYELSARALNLLMLPLRARFALVPTDEVGGPPLPLVSPVHAMCSACAAQQNDDGHLSHYHFDHFDRCLFG